MTMEMNEHDFWMVGRHWPSYMGRWVMKCMYIWCTSHFCFLFLLREIAMIKRSLARTLGFLWFFPGLCCLVLKLFLCTPIYTRRKVGYRQFIIRYLPLFWIINYSNWHARVPSYFINKWTRVKKERNQLSATNLFQWPRNAWPYDGMAFETVQDKPFFSSS